MGCLLCQVVNLQMSASQGRRNRYGHYGLDRSTFRPKKKVRGGFESRHVHVHRTQVRTYYVRNYRSTVHGPVQA